MICIKLSNIAKLINVWNFFLCKSQLFSQQTVDRRMQFKCVKDRPSKLKWEAKKSEKCRLVTVKKSSR